MIIVEIIVYAFYAYLLVGLVFAIWFVSRGVHRIDEGMRHAGWGVRLLLLPGSMALFPVLWQKYRKIDGQTGRQSNV